MARREGKFVEERIGGKYKNDASTEDSSKSDAVSKQSSEQCVTEQEADSWKKEVEAVSTKRLHPIQIKNEAIEHDVLESVLITPDFSTMHTAYFFSVPSNAPCKHEDDDASCDATATVIW